MEIKNKVNFREATENIPGPFRKSYELGYGQYQGGMFGRTEKVWTENKAIRTVRQLTALLLISFMAIMIAAFIEQLMSGVVKSYANYASSAMIGTIWGYIVFKLFRNHFESPMMLAVSVSFNEVFFLHAMDFFRGGVGALFSLSVVIQFLLFLWPAFVIFKNFRSIFEIR